MDFENEGIDFSAAFGEASARLDSAIGQVAARTFGRIPDDLQRQRWNTLKDNPTGRAAYIYRLAGQSGQSQDPASLAALERSYVEDMEARYATRS